MNKEKIIAGIERYIETTEAAERNMYRKALNDFSLKENQNVKEIYPKRKT